MPGELPLDLFQAAERLAGETIQLVVKVRNLQFGLKIDIIFDLGPDAVLCSLPILAQEHKNGQENCL